VYNWPSMKMTSGLNATRITFISCIVNKVRCLVVVLAVVITGSWDSSVGTATGYELYGRSSIPGRGKSFVCPP
jgi:hypothetical protein